VDLDSPANLASNFRTISSTLTICSY